MKTRTRRSASESAENTYETSVLTSKTSIVQEKYHNEAEARDALKSLDVNAVVPGATRGRSKRLGEKKNDLSPTTTDEVKKNDIVDMEMKANEAPNVETKRRTLSRGKTKKAAQEPAKLPDTALPTIARAAEVSDVVAPAIDSMAIKADKDMAAAENAPMASDEGPVADNRGGRGKKKAGKKAAAPPAAEALQEPSKTAAAEPVVVKEECAREEFESDADAIANQMASVSLGTELSQETKIPKRPINRAPKQYITSLPNSGSSAYYSNLMFGQTCWPPANGVASTVPPPPDANIQSATIAATNPALHDFLKSVVSADLAREILEEEKERKRAEKRREQYLIKKEMETSAAESSYVKSEPTDEMQ